MFARSRATFTSSSTSILSSTPWARAPMFMRETPFPYERRSGVRVRWPGASPCAGGGTPAQTDPARGAWPRIVGWHPRRLGGAARFAAPRPPGKKWVRRKAGGGPAGEVTDLGVGRAPADGDAAIGGTIEA